jgi:hypothetical protein
MLSIDDLAHLLKLKLTGVSVQELATEQDISKTALQTALQKLAYRIVHDEGIIPQNQPRYNQLAAFDEPNMLIEAYVAKQHARTHAKEDEAEAFIKLASVAQLGDRLPLPDSSVLYAVTASLLSESRTIRVNVIAGLSKLFWLDRELVLLASKDGLLVTDNVRVLKRAHRLLPKLYSKLFPRLQIQERG